MATYVVRTLKDGSKKVKVMVRRKNAPAITQTCRTRREAEAWAMTIEGEILSGQSSPRKYIRGDPAIQGVFSTE